MNAFKFTRGVIHFGILLLVFFGLISVTSVSVFSANAENVQRHLEKASYWQNLADAAQTKCQDPTLDEKLKEKACKDAQKYQQKAAKEQQKAAKEQAKIAIKNKVNKKAKTSKTTSPPSSTSTQTVSPTSPSPTLQPGPLPYPGNKGPCYPLGDVNFDGKLDSSDPDAILKHVSGTTTLSTRQQERADVSSDGNINSIDAALINQYLSGKISTFDGCSAIGDEVLPTPTPPIDLPLPSPSPISQSGPCPPLGDVNLDGKVDTSDPQAILEHEAGIKILSAIRQARANVNRDGQVNSVDAALIKQYLEGQITTFLACLGAANLDSDGDGFSNSLEVYLGTDPVVACPNHSGHAAWPPDIDNNGTISLLGDTLAVSTKIGSDLPRYDLNADGRVSLADALIVARYFGKTCTN